jgi:hypothetical protein
MKNFNWGLTWKKTSIKRNKNEIKNKKNEGWN